LPRSGAIEPFAESGKTPLLLSRDGRLVSAQPLYERTGPVDRYSTPRSANGDLIRQHGLAVGEVQGSLMRKLFRVVRACATGQYHRVVGK
jgi:hypothetical protein